MKPHQIRVLEECSRLVERIHKLDDFINSEKINVVSQDESVLLVMQLQAMILYRNLLRARIGSWSK